MKPLNQAVHQMKRSGIRVILDLASTMPDVIHLEIGQPDFPTPQHIIEAAYQAMQDGFTSYTANAGYASLRECIVEKLKRENGIRTAIDNIVITTGGMGGLYGAFSAILNPGDEVLLAGISYPNYEMISGINRAQVVRYPVDPQNDFLPLVDELPELVTQKTKAIVINSPCNPTGGVIPLETMQAMVTFAQKHDLYIISDECYEKIIYDAKHVSPAALDEDGRVLSVFSFSKTYSMTGWRVGYVAAPTEIAGALPKMQEATVSCAPSISQKAAEAAMKGSQACVTAMTAAYRRRRDRSLEILRQHHMQSYLPQGAFYLLVDIDGCGVGSEQFARDLIQDQKVAVAPGSTFGAQGDRFVRVSLATAEAQLVEGLERLCSYIEKRRKS